MGKCQIIKTSTNPTQIIINQQTGYTIFIKNSVVDDKINKHVDCIINFRSKYPPNYEIDNYDSIVYFKLVRRFNLVMSSFPIEIKLKNKKFDLKSYYIENKSKIYYAPGPEYLVKIIRCGYGHECEYDIIRVSKVYQSITVYTHEIGYLDLTSLEEIENPEETWEKYYQFAMDSFNFVNSLFQYYYNKNKTA